MADAVFFQPPNNTSTIGSDSLFLVAKTMCASLALSTEKLIDP